MSSHIPTVSEMNVLTHVAGQDHTARKALNVSHTDEWPQLTRVPVELRRGVQDRPVNMVEGIVRFQRKFYVVMRRVFAINDLTIRAETSGFATGASICGYPHDCHCRSRGAV